MPAGQKRNVEQGVYMNELKASNTIHVAHIEAFTHERIPSTVGLPRGVGPVQL